MQRESTNVIIHGKHYRQYRILNFSKWYAALFFFVFIRTFFSSFLSFSCGMQSAFILFEFVMYSNAIKHVTLLKYKTGARVIDRSTADMLIQLDIISVIIEIVPC